MEIKAEFDPGPVMRHLDEIERQTEELRGQVPIEFADWQEHDMGRQRTQSRTIDNERPTGNFVRSSTVIWPTSRRRVKRRRRAIRKLKKAGKGYRIAVSTRPVLRPMLLARFKDRFRNLLDRSY